MIPSLLLLLCLGRPGLADVTKQDVKKLLAAGLSDPVVVKFVEQNGPMEKLSPEDVAELKAAGASDSLIQALLEATTAKARPTYRDVEERVVVVPRETVVYTTPYASPYYYPYYSYPRAYYPYYYPRYNFHFSVPLGPRHPTRDFSRYRR
jgi:hypothetical protein